jgi:PIN domain nuclease of toxin-antitoxin system
MANYVTDTHALLWYLTDDGRLSKDANLIFEETERGEHLIIVPTIVLLESLDVIEKKRVAYDFDLVLQSIQDNENYIIWDLDLEVVSQVEKIRNVPELHDRIIVAIARLCDAGLITKDGEITESKEVKTEW